MLNYDCEITKSGVAQYKLLIPFFTARVKCVKFMPFKYFKQLCNVYYYTNGFTRSITKLIIKLKLLWYLIPIILKDEPLYETF